MTLLEPVPHPARTPTGSRRGNRPTVILAIIVVSVIGAALIGPLVGLEGERTVGLGYGPPSGAFPLGTDTLGRDVLARVVSGGGGLIGIAALATVIAIACGVTLGLLTARRSAAGSVLTWLLDIVLVVPAMVTLLVLIFGLGAGVVTMVVITSAVSAPFIARYTRALVRPVLASEFVLSARAGGDSWARVFVFEVGPVIIGPIAADAGARFVGSLYLVASASFLGFDPLGTGADWASMVQSGLGGIALNPWACLAPALAIAAVTVPANLLLDRIVSRGVV